jgi:hypothetical protein
MNILKVFLLFVIYRDTSSTRSRPNDWNPMAYKEPKSNDFRKHWKPIVDEDVKSNDFSNNYEEMFGTERKSNNFRQKYKETFSRNGCCCCCTTDPDTKLTSKMTEGLPSKPGLIILNCLRFGKVLYLVTFILKVFIVMIQFMNFLISSLYNKNWIKQNKNVK